VHVHIPLQWHNDIQQWRKLNADDISLQCKWATEVESDSITSDAIL